MPRNKLAYSQEQKDEIFEAICHDVILNKSSFNQAIKKSPITLVTFYDWLKKSDDFKEQYNYARNIRADVLFEEVIEIADEPQEGQEVTILPDGKRQIKQGDMTQHRRLQIDARKWVAAKMSPKKYGDKQEIDLNHSGKVNIKPKEWVKRKSK